MPSIGYLAVKPSYIDSDPVRIKSVPEYFKVLRGNTEQRSLQLASALSSRQIGGYLRNSLLPQIGVGRVNTEALAETKLMGL